VAMKYRWKCIFRDFERKFILNFDKRKKYSKQLSEK